MSQAMILSFTTPLMASVAARFILHEKLKITDIAGTITSAVMKHLILFNT